MYILGVECPKPHGLQCFLGIWADRVGYRADVLVRHEAPRGSIALFWGSADLPGKVSRDVGYRSDGIAISCDMEPLESGFSQF